MKSTQLKAMALGVCLASAPLSVLADDTDIYNNLDALESLDVRPNVLLILDTSYSMTYDGTPDDDADDVSRMDVMQDVLEDIFNNTELHGRINVGLARYNSSAGSIVYPLVELNPTNATQLVDRLQNHMKPSGETPIVPAFYEGVQYMLGRDVYGGLTRRDIPPYPNYYGRKRDARISHASTLEGGTWDSNDVDCDSMDASDDDCNGEEWDDNPTYISPIENQCQPNHIVLLTDGDANNNPSAVRDRVKAVINPDNPSSVTCEEDSDWACAKELAKHIYETDLFEDATKFLSNDEEHQRIVTHTIGFTFSDSRLEDISKEATSNDENQPSGLHRNTASAGELNDAFVSLFDSFMDINTTFSAPSATINQFNQLNHLDDIYFAVFRPEGNAVWPGNIKKYRLATGQIAGSDTPNDTSDDVSVDNNTIVDKYDRPAIESGTGFFKGDSIDFWSSRTPAGLQAIIDDGGELGFSVTEGGAANQIRDVVGPNGETRTVYTSISGTRETITGSNDNITKALLDIAGESDADWTRLRNWIAGVDVLDWDGDGATDDFRQQMGDPLHSRPVVVTYGKENIQTDPDTGAEISFDPILAMFFGTNDGYFRAIDANTGEEHFSFIPEEMLGDMQTRMDNAAGAHLYGVDGAPTVWVKDDNYNGIIETTGDDDDHVYVYFGFRRGGSSYYALDVTDLDNPTVLWRIDNTGDFAEMGQTWSKPIKTRILFDTDSNPNRYESAQRDVLVFTGGYDTNQDDISTNIHRRTDSKGRAVYVVDAETGSLLWKTDVTDNAAMAYSIPATMTVIDPDVSGHADQMYVGDMGGQIWRFDINSGAYWDGTGALPTNFINAQVVATLAADNSDANARRFYQSPDIALMKDDGELKIVLAIGSGYRARPNETGVQDRFYMMKLPNPYEPLGSFTPLTHDELVDVTDNINPTFQDTDFGWWIDMENSGEKVLSTPLIVSGKVIWVTYEPTARLVGCTVQPGTSREYVVNLEDGSPVYNQSGDIDDPLDKDDRSRDLAGGSIVDEPVIIFTEEGGGSSFLGVEQGTERIEMRDPRTFWIEKE